MCICPTVTVAKVLSLSHTLLSPNSGETPKKPCWEISPLTPGKGCRVWLAGARQAFHPGGGSSFYWCCMEIEAGPTTAGRNVFPIYSAIPEEAGAAQQAMGVFDSVLLKSRSVWFFLNVVPPHLLGAARSGSAALPGL